MESSTTFASFLEMKPRRQFEKDGYPGYTIRLSKDDIADIKRLSAPFGLPTLNRVLAAMVMEVVTLSLGSCTTFDPKGLLLLRYPGRELDAEAWQGLAVRNLTRSAPNLDTLPIKLSFPEPHRKAVRQLAEWLRWAEGQVIVESLQAFCTFLGARSRLQVLPDIIQLSRARVAFIDTSSETVESAQSVLDALNHGLGLGRTRH